MTESTANALILSNVAKEFPDFLRDESRLVGQADSISFPRSVEDIRAVLAMMSSKKVPVTVQGARTGITGGAVPGGGHILNLSRMNRITALRHDPVLDLYFVTVQPGVLLSQLRTALHSREFDTSGWSQESIGCLTGFQQAEARFFPPDPTETSAAIGGMVAANASGACSFHYGPTRRYVEGAVIALHDGSLCSLRREGMKAAGRSFSLTAQGGRTIAGVLPLYTAPNVKNAAGYYVSDNMDLLDLFIGSEGTLGVFCEIELRLIPSPPVQWTVAAFFPSEECALTFVESLRSSPARPVAMEFFDGKALALLREQRRANPAFAELPDPPAGYDTAVFTEYHGADEDAVSDAVATASDIMVTAGGNEQATWFASNDRERERLKSFRHALPEAVNLLIDQRRRAVPTLTKLGTDMAVPDAHLRTVLRMYHRGLQERDLDYVMFGHIGNNHIHVNILPRTMDDYEHGKGLYRNWAMEIIRMGGTVSAEHGIGKLKVALLEEMYGKQAVEQMRNLKKLFDPDNILNMGNLF